MTMTHISTGSDSFQAWRTPRQLAAALIREYELYIDVAADSQNALCPMFFDEETSGLKAPWGQNVWCNPPYADVGPWLQKGLEEVHARQNCDRAVFLVPASIGVEWFTDACTFAEVHIFDQRIKFEVPPARDLSPQLLVRLYHENGSPKNSPGGGNALIIIERNGLTGITGLRSSLDGRFLMDFHSGERFE